MSNSSLNHPEFNIHEADVAQRWTMYIKRFGYLLSIHKVAEDDKLDYLLYVAGNDIIRLYEEIALKTDNYTAVVA